MTLLDLADCILQEILEDDFIPAISRAWCNGRSTM